MLVRHAVSSPVASRLGLFAAVIALLALPALAGCQSPKPDWTRPLPPGAHALVPVAEPTRIPSFAPIFDSRREARESLAQSLDYFSRPSSKDHFPYDCSDREISHAVQIASLEVLDDLLATSRSPEELDRRIRENFDVYRSVGWDNRSGDVLFTAYYTPILEGSRVRTSEFRFPLYALPDDLVKAKDGRPLGRRTADGDIVPYYTRREIESEDHLAGQELVFLRDPFDAFLPHVQGSAIIELTSGERLTLGYAGKTDRDHISVGDMLVKRGVMRAEEKSLAKIRAHFREQPDDLPLLDAYERYVFFEKLEVSGPFGSLGVPVTPRHSVATDKSVFPRGGAVVAVTELPTGGYGVPNLMRPHTGLYFDQDTGGAIQSAGRADLYLGVGERAERIAGYTKQVGRLYYLFLKEGFVAPGAR